MKHGSLFSGIGGFDLAAEWMGWENVFHCEWNDFGKKVLKYYWPKSISYEDITKTDFNVHKGEIDILTGGFPCQPYSQAGKRLGKEDDRHLWPEMLRAIREIQPSWVLGENVRGLVNWSGGLVFEEVQADMEAEGYEVQPFILPACAKDAPHRRDRVWFVANSMHNRYNSERREEKEEETVSGKCGKEMESRQFDGTNISSTAPDTNSNRLQGCVPSIFDRQIPRKEKYDEKHLSIRRQGVQFENFPTQSPICGGDDGFPSELDGITFSKWRNESIKAYGNAVVPQVVYEIFKAIQEYENR